MRINTCIYHTLPYMHLTPRLLHWTDDWKGLRTMLLQYFFFVFGNGWRYHCCKPEIQTLYNLCLEERAYSYIHIWHVYQYNIFREKNNLQFTVHIKNKVFLEIWLCNIKKIYILLKQYMLDSKKIKKPLV